MKPNLTDVTLLIDRSSSMRMVQRSAELGVNAFIRRQVDAPGDAVLTLIQFDRGYDVVCQATPVQDAPPFRLFLGLGTALLDAMGRAMNETHARITALPEADRPALIVFVVVSDGYENASKEFSKGEIRRTVNRQRDDYNWQFTFLGANQNVAYEAGSLGFDLRSSAPWLSERVSQAYEAAAESVVRMRRQRSSGESIDNSFTDDERNNMT